MKVYINLLIISLTLFMSGCTTTGEKIAMQPVFDLKLLDEIDESQGASDGSLYNHNSSISLYSDNKARNIGDIITIQLTEQTNATKSASTTTSKDNALDVGNPTLFGSAFSGSLPGFLPLGGSNRTLDASLTSSKTFSGEGDSAQSNQMTGTITAIVTKRLPNGNLIISGKKRITINSGDEYLHITGIVRPKDISGNNSVVSTKNCKMQKLLIVVLVMCQM